MNAEELERLAALELRIAKLEGASHRVADLMSTLGGKFTHAHTGILTEELRKFFEEVGRTLTSINKG